MRKPLGHKSSRFKFRFNGYNLIVFLLIVAVIAGSFYLFALINNTGNQNPVPEPIAIRSEEKPLLKWWNMNWRNAKRIKVINPTYEELKEGSLAQFTFNHKELVDEKISNETGRDLRLIFQDEENKLIPINFSVESPNSTSTTIIFRTAESLPLRYTTSRYFLYYNTIDTSSNNFIVPKSPETVTVATITEVEERINSAFEAQINRKWILKGANLPQEYKILNTTITSNPVFGLNDRAVLAEVAGTNIKSSLATVKNNSAIVSLDLSNLNPGKYKVNFKIDTYETSQEVFVSFPLYATWTMDWEGYDVKDEFLKQLDELSNGYKMPITHYFNPRIYINNSISQSRRNFLTNWVKERKASRGDEISMHLHMHYDFIEAAGVEKRIEPSWGGGNDGYDVLTAAYTPEEFRKIVQFGQQKFKENNLSAPVGYRAGGWFINTDNLRVLPELGFKYDSSGRDAYVFGKNRARGFWNLRSTTKPYKMSFSDQNSSRPPVMNLWQFPNNGADSTNLETIEMIKRLNENFKGEPLTDKQVITFLSHPHWFNQDYPRMKELFEEIDKYKAENGNGPIVYITLEDAYNEYSSN